MQFLDQHWFSITVCDSTERFCGVGSEPRPGNAPSIFWLTRNVSQSSNSQKLGADTVCAPFPKSKTTLKCFDSISLESTWEMDSLQDMFQLH